MTKKKTYLSDMHELTTCLVATHHGVEGYGGVPRAAEIAVQMFGYEWLDKHPKLKKDEKIRDFLQMLTKLSCPKNYSNKDQPWKRVQEAAHKYVVRVHPQARSSKKVKADG